MQDGAAAAMDLCKVRAQLQRPAIAGKGLAESSECEKRIASIVMRFGIVGSRRQRLIEACQGHIEPPFIFQRISEVEQGLGKIRLQGKSAGIVYDGLIESSEGVEHQAAIVETQQVVRINSQRGIDLRESAPMVSALVIDQSAQMQGIKDIRLAYENLRVDAFRLRHAAGLVVRKSFGEQCGHVIRFRPLRLGHAHEALPDSLGRRRIMG